MKKEQIKEERDYLLIKKWADLMVIQGEKVKDFTNFALKTLQDIAPQTEIEISLCEKYIFLSWKLRRVIEHEKYVLSEQNKSLNEIEVLKIEMGRMKGRRVRNIERIDLSDPSVINLTQQQYELDRRINKTLDRIRAEQRKHQQK